MPAKRLMHPCHQKSHFWLASHRFPTSVLECVPCCCTWTKYSSHWVDTLTKQQNKWGPYIYNSIKIAWQMWSYEIAGSHNEHLRFNCSAQGFINKERESLSWHPGNRLWYVNDKFGNFTLTFNLFFPCLPLIYFNINKSKIKSVCTALFRLHRKKLVLKSVWCTAGREHKVFDPIIRISLYI